MAMRVASTPLLKGECHSSAKRNHDNPQHITARAIADGIDTPLVSRIS